MTKRMQLPTADAAEIRAMIEKDGCWEWKNSEGPYHHMIEPSLEEFVGDSRVNALDMLGHVDRGEFKNEFVCFVAAHLIPLDLSVNCHPRGWYVAWDYLQGDSMEPWCFDHLDALIAALESWEKEHA